MRQHRLFFLVLICYMGLSSVLIFRFPAFSGPNEDLHYEYIAMMRQNGRLPDLTTSHRADERHQPPVYYAVATLFTLPFSDTKLDTDYQKNPYYTATLQGNLNRFIHVTPQNAPELYLSRYASMFFGIIALTSIYAGARLTLPLPVSLLTVSLVAFQPTFLQLSAVVNNDLAATGMSALLIAYTTYLLQKEKGPRAYLLWGVLFALAMLTKASVAFLFGSLLVCCWTIWRTGKGWKTAVFSGLSGIIPFLLLWSIWLIFNQIRSQDALGLSASIPVFTLLNLSLQDFALLLPYLGEIFCSYWLDWSPGILGYGPWWFYLLWCSFLLIAFTGWFWKTPRFSQPLSILRLHLFWVVLLGGGFIAVKTMMIRDVGFLVPEGRWLLPILPSLAWLAGTGFSHWTGDRSPTRLLKFAALLPPLSAVILLLWFFPTRYPQAEKLNSVSEIPNTMKRVNLTYNQQVKLLGFEAESFKLGENKEITLYWQALQSPTADYTVSAQMLYFKEDRWQPLSIQNSYPGSGLNPTGDWQAGDIFREQLVFQPEGELAGPTSARLVFSLKAGEAEISIAQNGQPVDWPVAGEVIVRPTVPLPLPDNSSQLNEPITFGELFDLAAFTYTVEENKLLVTLWWKANTNISGDYIVFLHLLDERGQLYAQSDSIPADGASPTNIWQTGDVIVDQHHLPFDANTEMTLLIGVYDSQTITRLPVVQHGELLPDLVWRQKIP